MCGQCSLYSACFMARLQTKCAQTCTLQSDGWTPNPPSAVYSSERFGVHLTHVCCTCFSDYAPISYTLEMWWCRETESTHQTQRHFWHIVISKECQPLRYTAQERWPGWPCLNERAEVTTTWQSVFNELCSCDSHGISILFI
jgi:hypothetical protein